MKSGRRAQAGAAVLVVLIALLIILYVLFLPPTERAILLGEDVVTTPAIPPSVDEDVISIFSGIPGQVQQPMLPEETLLPSFIVKTVTQGNVLAERSVVELTRSAFHNDRETLVYTVPQNAENILLSYGVSSREGDLIISSDGDVLTRQSLSQRQPSPIALPSSPQTHELTFETSGVGFAIWESNRVQLNNVRITADVTSFNRAGQEQQFVLYGVNETKSIRLVFVPECQGNQGRLSITLNSKTLYSGFPLCGVPISTDLPRSQLQEGENTLSWSVQEGEYIIDQSAIITEREQKDNTDTFSLSPELLNRVIGSDREIYLELSFAGQGSEGVIVVNGADLAFRTAKQTFAAPITSYVRSGQNTIAIAHASTPISSVNIFTQR